MTWCYFPFHPSPNNVSNCIELGQMMYFFMMQKPNGVLRLCCDAATARDNENSRGDINDNDMSSLPNSSTGFTSTCTAIDIVEPKTELDDGDIEDDIDPELKEKIDK